MTIKRFIAGAICPACSAQDRLRYWEEDRVPHRDCVACGYQDTLDVNGNPIPELPTRVSPRAPTPTTGAQTLHFQPYKPRS